MVVTVDLVAQDCLTGHREVEEQREEGEHIWEERAVFKDTARSVKEIYHLRFRDPWLTGTCFYNKTRL